ncbi:P-loop containing nucleoside triphosphate hydrolase protein [Mycena floridula]|nr:P-loop containing nucleoside triphosphate hydrolase protein [Mycena floridula]
MSTPQQQHPSSNYRALEAISYASLQEARQNAAKKKKYNSAETRLELQALFTAKFGKPAHQWQIDVVEAIFLGLDCILAAGTGMGKTIPFMMILLPDQKRRIAAVVSPLKVLQQDQQERFLAMGINAGRVNGDTWRREKVRQNVDQNKYQAILAGPEMWLKHDGFRKSLRESKFLQDTAAIVIDEGHCISQWGRDFRKAYAELDKLRALFPPGTPVLCASATLNKTALRDVRSTLAIDSDSCFHLNLGNDRVNISTEVHKMKNSDDFDALNAVINIHPTNPSLTKKTLVFTNTVKTCQQLARDFKAKYKHLPLGTIDFLHAYRSRRDKRKVMKRFKSGKIWVLFATESVGMSTDIADIEVVIQFGVPTSLTVFLQRIGRAGRLASLRTRAILLVQESMFKRRKKKKPQKKTQKLAAVPFTISKFALVVESLGKDSKSELDVVV